MLSVQTKVLEYESQQIPPWHLLCISKVSRSLHSSKTPCHMPLCTVGCGPLRLSVFAVSSFWYGRYAVVSVVPRAIHPTFYESILHSNSLKILITCRMCIYVACGEKKIVQQTSPHTDKDYCLLQCDATWFGRSLPICRRNLLPAFSDF